VQAGAKSATSRPERAGVYRLFVDALEMREDLRDQFLARECHGDPGSRAEVEDLLRLAIDDKTTTRAFLPRQPALLPEDLLGRDYGRFRLVELIGAGGMGVVYRAERTDGVKQCVAVKVASRAVATAAQMRFESEAHVLARLEHPAVARLIDAGVQNGRAWIAMEFVAGERIDKYCRNRGLGVREIVALVVQLADAVSAAHRLLVVHSDIKPANVLVTSDGMPKLIDFGIATAAREAEPAPAASIGGRLFSPGFAAPEQITGDGITVATDVFGLGALAYYLLTGRPPHDADEPGLRYSHAVLTRDVLPASQAATPAGRTPADIRQLRGDLDAILGKSLSREPQKRYSSAADLRADLARFLERRPVRARRAGLMYRFGKFTRRNALACALTGLLMAVSIAGGAVMALQMHRETLARNMATRRDAFLESLLKSADPRGGRRDVSVAELLDVATSELDEKLFSEPLVEASMLGLIAQTNNGLGRYAEGLTASERQIALLRGHAAGSIELGQALSMRGELLREQGKWLDAEPLLREAVALLRPARVAADFCQAMYVLGVVQMHVNQEEDALRTFREVIDIESGGDRGLQKLRIFPYQAISITLSNLGRYAEALESARDAVTVARQSVAADHPDALGADVTYAGALVNVHRYTEAEPMFRRVIATQTQVLGEAHKDTLLTQLMLIDELLDLQRNAEAADLALSTARRLEPLLGKDNMYTQTAWQNYGSAACNNGLTDAGLDILRRVESAWRELRPAGDRLIYGAGLSVGECLFHAHRYAEAEGALLTAAGGLEAARGPAYRRTQQAYRALRDLYAATDRASEASLWSAKLIQ
jgi:eukaryotic-like serine/threonine-protein kinase